MDLFLFLFLFLFSWTFLAAYSTECWKIKKNKQLRQFSMWEMTKQQKKSEFPLLSTNVWQLFFINYLIIFGKTTNKSKKKKKQKPKHQEMFTMRSQLLFFGEVFKLLHWRQNFNKNNQLDLNNSN